MKEGWVAKALANVSAIRYGYTESASSEAIGPRFLRITDIQDDHVDWERVP
jgi:type I restriction enzyme S subunit